MPSVFLVSDTHFGHAGVCRFTHPDDPEIKLRPWDNADEMDEEMIRRWNDRVRPNDKVYHLGDVVINRKALKTLSRLNGDKVLIRGNHDIFKDEDYRAVGFEQMHGVRVFVDKFILSHIPLHPDCVSERFRVNVHGHLHANEVMRTRTNMVHGYMTGLVTEPDPQYLCVCVEQTDFTPLHFDEVEERIQQRWKDAGYEGPVKAWGNGSGPG
jgi:calcineurin-like phosphoesterase family protein